MEGDVVDDDGVLRIASIRIRYRLTIPGGARERFDRLLGSYADKCPAYQSVRGCIDVSWEADVTEE